MNGSIKTTTKERCAMILLSCMSWGSSINGNSESEITSKIRKRLKFQNDSNILRFRSCIDLIEDTENAIISFSTYGIAKYSEKINDDYGEIYIRLYGILNAIYLQLNAIIEIYEICKVPNKNLIKNKLKAHKIFELRNIMGAHTVNFEDTKKSKEKTIISFRVTQMQLKAKGENLHAVDNLGNVREYNLYKLVMSYNRLSEKLLYDACIDYMNRIFTSRDKVNALLLHYELEIFKNYNYGRLYKNDKLLKADLKKIKKRINADGISIDKLELPIEITELFGYKVIKFKDE
jgi:hypothetical protein